MTIVFYDCKTAPSPRRARIILAEKNVPHETIEIDIKHNEQMSDAFRAINPNCTVPALKLEDGTVLKDNAGIAAFLEAFYPDPPLMGETALEKAEIASWQSQIEQEFLMAVAHALRNANPAMKGRALPGPENYEQIPALAERGAQQVETFFKKLDQRLDGRRYIATDKFSIADITAAVALDFTRIIRKKPFDTQVNIKRWRDGLNERASFAL